MIAIIDYGVGNLFSLKSSLAAIGREAVVTGGPSGPPGGQPRDPPRRGGFRRRGGPAAGRQAWRRRYWRPLPQASPSWASAWGCSSSWSAPLSTRSTPAWASFRGRCAPSGRDSGGAGRAPWAGTPSASRQAAPATPFSRLWRRGARLFRPLLRGLCLRRGAHRLDRVRRASDGGGAERKRVRDSSTRRRAGMWDCGFSRHSADWRVKHDSASGD